MKKVFKSFAALMLALALTVTCTPTTVHAAAALRDYAQFGESYRVYTVLPGNVKIYGNAVVTGVDTYYYSSKGYYETTVKMELTIPKSQQKKVQKNVSHILNSSPVVKRIGSYRYHRAHYTYSAAVLDAQTNMPLTLANTGNQAGIAYGNFYGYNRKYMKQGRNSLYLDTTYSFYVRAQYTPVMQGNILFGIAGTKKATFDNNGAMKSFSNGNRSFKSTNLYNKKSNKNSIFVRQ